VGITGGEGELTMENDRVYAYANQMQARFVPHSRLRTSGGPVWGTCLGSHRDMSTRASTRNGGREGG